MVRTAAEAGRKGRALTMRSTPALKGGGEGEKRIATCPETRRSSEGLCPPQH